MELGYNLTRIVLAQIRRQSMFPDVEVLKNQALGKEFASTANCGASKRQNRNPLSSGIKCSSGLGQINH